MQAYWLNDGKPLDDGRFCRVTDLEDGTIPIKTYGRTQQEVYDKIERTNMHAQMALAQRRTGGGNGNGAAQVPKKPTAGAAPPRMLTADEQMQVTADLGNPARSPGAVVKLFESATGLSVDDLVLANFMKIAEAWQDTHPELKDSLYNKKLITDNARMRAGGQLRNITPEILEQVFQELYAGGYLLTEDEASLNHGSQPPAVLPEEIPAPVPARPRSAFATGHRSTRLAAPQVASWKPKYTREGLQNLTTKETERLLKSGDKDYREACDYWYPRAQSV